MLIGLGDGYPKPLEMEDIVKFLPIMREEDRAEVRATLGVEPEVCLPLFANAPDTIALVDSNGIPKGICGVGPVEGNPLLGMVWMVASDSLRENSIVFLRNTRSQLESWHEKYPILYAYTDARNTLHHKWLRWAGFKFIAKKEKWGAEGLPFYEVVRIKQ